MAGESSPPQFLASHHLAILPHGFAPGRVAMTTRIAIRHGARVDSTLAFPLDLHTTTTPPTIIVADHLDIASLAHALVRGIDDAENVDRFLSATRILPARWFVECCKSERCVDTFSSLNQSLRTLLTAALAAATATTKRPRLKPPPCAYKRRPAESGGLAPAFLEKSGSDSKTTPQDRLGKMRTESDLAVRYLCSRPWPSARAANCNRQLTDRLDELCSIYRSEGDEYRTLAYEKAIVTLKCHPDPIRHSDDVRSIRNIGDGIGKKILEIIETGTCEKLQRLLADERVVAMRLFADIWGIGPRQAHEWAYKSGYRSLEEIRRLEWDRLQPQQRIGLDHYDAFLDRMPRAEVELIGEHVRATLDRVGASGCVCTTAGSYRRGRSTCGDVDILISHPDGKSHRGLLEKLRGKLSEEGFLTHHLAWPGDGEQQKYMGVCRLLPSSSSSERGGRPRRIDLIVVPFDEYPCALVAWTGSALLNRSLRALAHQLDMRLDHHALRRGRDRQGEIVPIQDEQSLFRTLGLEYLEPTDRDA